MRQKVEIAALGAAYVFSLLWRISIHITPKEALWWLWLVTRESILVFLVIVISQEVRKRRRRK